MAHTCPECGIECHCNGDFEDMVLDTDESFVTCTHCLSNLDEDDFVEDGHTDAEEDLEIYFILK